MPDSEASGQLNAMLCSTQMLTRERKMLPDRSEAGQELLCPPRCAKNLHPKLVFTCRLMGILSPVVDSGCRFDKHMFDASERGHLRFCPQITAQLLSDDLVWAIQILDQQPLEEALGGCLVTALLQQNIELRAMLIDGTP